MIRLSFSQFPPLNELIMYMLCLASHLTPKFYAHHEGTESLDNVDPETLDLIVNYHSHGPREKIDYPATANQRCVT